jgi:hypothetical protein
MSSISKFSAMENVNGKTTITARVIEPSIQSPWLNNAIIDCGRVSERSCPWVCKLRKVKKLENSKAQIAVVEKTAMRLKALRCTRVMT